MSVFETNYQLLKDDIERAAHEVQRDASSVRLMAVSKGHDGTAIKAALDCGHRLFGENRVQEAKQKFSGLREQYQDLELHLIGPLQTNKALDAVKLFDVIETLDRPTLAEALSAAMAKAGRHPSCYIEVNIGHEEQKAGVEPEKLGDFLNYCRSLEGLTIEGLMCIPPQNQVPELFFMRMKELAVAHRLPHLSMGMSGDYREAIHCGATIIRVGTALFGPRSSPEI